MKMFYPMKSHMVLNCVWTNDNTTFCWNLASNADDLGIFTLSTVIEKSKNIVRFPVSLLKAFSLFSLVHKYKVLLKLLHRNRIRI